MTITDKQIEAAAEALWDDHRCSSELSEIFASMSWAELRRAAACPNAIKVTVDAFEVCLRAARAALEAGEAAAWSTDMEAAPALTDLLVWIGHKVKECMVFKDKNGTRAWSVEDSDYRDEDIRAWRLRPTPPTEGDR